MITKAEDVCLVAVVIYLLKGFSLIFVSILDFFFFVADAGVRQWKTNKKKKQKMFLFIAFTDLKAVSVFSLKAISVKKG